MSELKINPDTEKYTGEHIVIPDGVVDIGIVFRCFTVRAYECV